MSKTEKLVTLRQDWQDSNDRIATLSTLVGRDHTQAAILIGQEFRMRMLIKEQILQLQKEVGE